MRIVSLLLAFIPPLLLKAILEGLGSEEPSARQSVFFLVFLTVAARLLRVIVDGVWSWHVRFNCKLFGYELEKLKKPWVPLDEKNV